MSNLADAVSTAFDAGTGTGHSAANVPAATVETPIPATEGQEINASAETTPEPSAETTPDPQADNSRLSPTVPPATTETRSPVDLADLESVKARVLADNPELEPIVTAKFREIDRIVNKKLEQLAALRKETAEQVVLDERIKSIPPDELAGFAQLYQTLNHGTPQQKEEAADYLFQLQEDLRSQSVNSPANTVNDSSGFRSTPEWQEFRTFQFQQSLQQTQQQLDAKYTELQPEYGGQPIPTHQREHVEELARQKNLSVEDIPMVWRHLYGNDFAKQEGIRKGQQLRKEKESLGIGNSTAPPPSPVGGDANPKNLRDAVASVCDSRGIR
jgi:hypothetical protein